MKAASIISSLAALAAPALAAPFVTRDAATPFTAVAIHSGSAIQFSPINANGTTIWLNRASATYTPTGLGPFNQTATVFVGGNDTLSLDVATPGGQQVYVDAAGYLRFTVAHSANTGVGSKTTGFGFRGNDLTFEGQDWIACPYGSVDNAYNVYAAAVAGDASEACLGFAFYTSPATGGVAFEYE